MSDTNERWSDLPLEFVPERLSFVPEVVDRQSFDLTWREMLLPDLPQVSRIVKTEGAKGAGVGFNFLRKCAVASGWCGRVALRNKSTIIAVYAAEHLIHGGYNNLKFLWVHPDYLNTKVPTRLLQLARIEMPELPSKATIAASNTAMHSYLRNAGWTDLTDERDEQADRRTFHIQAVGGVEYRKTLQARSTARHAPAGSQPRRRGERRGGDTVGDADEVGRQ